MAKINIPVYSICSLAADLAASNDFMADDFGHYLSVHKDLQFPHKHSFYHLVYFTKGAGTHNIDFINFKVKPGQVYFMIPGQVHSWNFKGDMQGYIINFSANFIQQLVTNSRYLEQFSFFSGIASQQVLIIPPANRAAVVHLFETIMKEQSSAEIHTVDFTRTALLQLLFIADRTMPVKQQQQSNYNSILLRNFQNLLEQHFRTKKLTRDYAALLYVTPNHLNALSKDMGGRSAGEMIRDRVLLEAKRLLVNADMSIAEIASALDFEDNSYFSKFFKKYEGLSPQEFRKKIIK